MALRHPYLIVLLPEEHSQRDVDHEEVEKWTPHLGAPDVGHKIEDIFGQGESEH